MSDNRQTEGGSTMDLSNVITMDAGEAAVHAKQYRDIKQPTDEDRRIVAIFTALAAGKQVVDINQAISDAGPDENGRPVLAAMWASEPWCYLYHWRGGEVQFRPSNAGRTNSRRLRVGTAMPEITDHHNAGYWGSHGAVRSQVPMVPPQHRKWGYRSMVVLWEVEEWAKAPRPPGDPILLKPLLGSLYTVEAAWDLTEVERLVLGQRP